MFLFNYNASFNDIILSTTELKSKFYYLQKYIIFITNRYLQMMYLTFKKISILYQQFIEFAKCQNNTEMISVKIMKISSGIL